MDKVDLKFTICFPVKDNYVLLIYRQKKPWINHWNGVGGKLLPGEKPLDCVIRETREETGIDLAQAKKTVFTGIVTWNTAPMGMYVFVSYLSDKQPLWEEERQTSEGPLAWKPLDWVLDSHNPHVARNIPGFLPLMLKKDSQPKEYFCIFDKQGTFSHVAVKALPEDIRF